MIEKSSSWIIAAVLGLSLVALWVSGYGPYISWGGDWAGYLLQAQSLTADNVMTEVEVNSIVMRDSDIQIGPDAYPWGFPILLAAAGLTLGWSIESLKMVGGLSLVLVTLATYSLSRHYLSRNLSLVVAAFVSLQPSILSSSISLGSDIPFLGISTITLLLVVKQYRGATSSGTLSGRLALSIIVLGVIAFAIRSNGAILLATYIGCLLLAAVWKDISWRSWLGHSVGFALLSAALMFAYFSVLPDGSLSHAGYLTLEPSVLISQAINHLKIINDFLPFDFLPGIFKLAILIPVLALVVLAVTQQLKQLSPLILYVAGHLVLLTLFPYSGGSRYYFPLLAPIFVLAFLGLEQASGKISESIERFESQKVNFWMTVPLALMVIAAMSLESRGYLHEETEAYRESGPYSVDATNAFEYIKRNVGTEKQIAFRKPRVMRFLTGHAAISVSETSRLRDIDYYVLLSSEIDGQVRPDELVANDFRLVFEQDNIAVFENTMRAAQP